MSFHVPFGRVDKESAGIGEDLKDHKESGAQNQAYQDLAEACPLPEKASPAVRTG